MLVGYTPFYGEDQNELFDAIMKGAYDFDDEYWGDISDEGMYHPLNENIVKILKLTQQSISCSQEHD